MPFDANYCPYCCKKLKRDLSQEQIRLHKFLKEMDEELKKKRKKDANN